MERRVQTILVVDDEESIRTTFAIFLQQEGYTVHTAGSVQEAAQLLQEQRFDLVVSDIVLPDAPGVNLLREVRNGDPLCPVILVTGRPAVDTATQALREGAFEYLLKPVKRTELLRTVRQALERRTLLQGKQQLEQENQRYRRQLEELVQHRTRQLMETNSLLQRELAQRRKAQEELRLERERLALALKISGAAAFEARPVEGRFIYDADFAELAGFPKEELDRLHKLDDTWLQRFHPEDLPGCLEQFAAIEAGQVPGYELIFRARSPEGQWRYIHNLARVVDRLSDGRPSRVVGVIKDITSRKQAELALAESHHLLERRVEERTRELRLAEARLRRLSARQDKLVEEERIRIAREIHDELGQNLTALNMGLAVLGSRINSLEPEVTQRLADLRRNLEQMIATVQRICQELRPMLLDDLGLLPAIAWRIEELQNSGGLEISLQAEPPDLHLEPGLANSVYRLVQEALTNVGRHAAATAITVKLQRGDDFLRIQVTDNGRGMDAEAMEAPESLGIMGMRERMRNLGGELHILSAPGQGTTVQAVLPLRRQEDRPHAESVPQAS